MIFECLVLILLSAISVTHCSHLAILDLCEEYPDISVQGCAEHGELIDRIDNLHDLWEILFPGSLAIEHRRKRQNLEHLDGILVRAWIYLYLHDPASERAQRLEELKRISETYPDGLTVELLRRVEEELFASLADHEKEIKDNFESELRRLDDRIPELEMNIESLESEKTVLTADFENHVEKFFFVNGLMRQIQVNTVGSPKSPDFKPFGGFENAKSQMNSLVQAMNEAFEKDEIQPLQKKIFDLIRSLKVSGLEPSGIWRVCKEAHGTVVDRSQDRLRIKRMSHELEELKNEVEELRRRKARIEELLSQ